MPIFERKLSKLTFLELCVLRNSGIKLQLVAESQKFLP